MEAHILLLLYTRPQPSSHVAYQTRTHWMARNRNSPCSRRNLMVFDLLTPSQGHQFDPRVNFSVYPGLLVINLIWYAIRLCSGNLIFRTRPMRHNKSHRIHSMGAIWPHISFCLLIVKGLDRWNGNLLLVCCSCLLFSFFSCVFQVFF